MSPYSSNVYSEMITRAALRYFMETVKNGGRAITGLRYVDNVALLAAAGMNGRKGR